MYEYGCTKANSEMEERLVVELVYLDGPQAVRNKRAAKPAIRRSFISVIIFFRQRYVIKANYTTYLLEIRL